MIRESTIPVPEWVAGWDATVSTSPTSGTNARFRAAHVVCIVFPGDADRRAENPDFTGDRSVFDISVSLERDAGGTPAVWHLVVSGGRGGITAAQSARLPVGIKRAAFERILRHTLRTAGNAVEASARILCAAGVAP